MLAPIAAAAADAAVPHLAAASPAPLRTAAAQLLLALARLDADALWLLLFRLSDQVPLSGLQPVVLLNALCYLQCSAAQHDMSNAACKALEALLESLLSSISFCLPLA